MAPLILRPATGAATTRHGAEHSLTCFAALIHNIPRCRLCNSSRPSRKIQWRSVWMPTGGSSAHSWRRYHSQVLTSHSVKGLCNVDMVPKATDIHRYVYRKLIKFLSGCRGCLSILSVLGLNKVRMTSTYMPCSCCSSPARTVQWSPPGTSLSHLCGRALTPFYLPLSMRFPCLRACGWESGTLEGGVVSGWRQSHVDSVLKKLPQSEG